MADFEINGHEIVCAGVYTEFSLQGGMSMLAPPAWGASSADMAEIFYQPAVRVAIHANDLIS